MPPRPPEPTSKNEKIPTLISPEPAQDRVVQFPQSAPPPKPPHRKLVPYIFLGVMIGLAVICAVVWLSGPEWSKQPTSKIIIQPQPK
jgi:hypothetical protein